MSTLFDPIQFGSLKARNRIVMAPLTRNRAGPRQTPTALMALYYEQRSSAGLIVSEATQIAPEAQGYRDTPGIYSAEQLGGWRAVTKSRGFESGEGVMNYDLDMPPYIQEMADWLDDRGLLKASAGN